MATIYKSSEKPGTIVEFGGGVIPSGNIGCDGASLLVADFPNLHGEIGFAFGGSGANFNVPDKRRRIAVGSGGSGTGELGNAVGNTGGAETHPLIIAELAAHTHSVNLSQVLGTNAFARGANGPTDGAGGMTSTGSGTAHNNIQPSLVVTFMIRF